MPPGRVTIEDNDHGFKRVAEMMGELGSVVLGVQGKEAEQPHPTADGLTVGELAAVHHEGKGVKRRAWLETWIKQNQGRLRAEAARELEEVIRGGTTRNKALQRLGYKWCAELRDWVWAGKVTPPLAASTIQRKGGETRPLIDTHTLVNAITYKVFLPQLKSIRDTVQRAAARRK